MTEALKINRPLIEYWWPQLRDLHIKRYDDPAGLQEILVELLFRHSDGALDLREQVVLRLVELSEESFLWPTTDTPDGDGTLDGIEWPQEGLLSFLGYHVGQNGVRADDRRAILDSTYKGSLPNVNSAEYMASWEAPGSADRLRKLAESLAAFCRNQKRRDPSAVAVREWEADLEYLRHEYYDGRYSFVWPRTDLM